MTKRIKWLPLFIAILLAVCCVPFIAGLAFAQDDGGDGGDGGEGGEEGGEGGGGAQCTCGDDYSGCSVAMYSNGYVNAYFGSSGSVNRIGHSISDPAQTVQFSLPVAGRWCITDPNEEVALNMYAPNKAAHDAHEAHGSSNGYTGVPCGTYGIIKIKVDGKISLVGSSGGYWKKAPATTPKPPAGYGEGLLGGFIEGIWVVSTGSNSDESTASASVYSANDAKAKTEAVIINETIEVRIRMYCVNKYVRFEYLITNRSASNHTVGICMGCDIPENPFNSGCENSSYIAGPSVNDAIEPLYGLFNETFLPGIGKEANNVGDWWPETYGTWNDPVRAKAEPLLSVPDSCDFFDDISAPAVNARILFGKADATKPDFFAIGNAGELNGDGSWPSIDYDPDHLLTTVDMYWSAVWEPKTVKSQASTKIVTYYGFGEDEAVWSTGTGADAILDWVSLTTHAPKAINVTNGVFDPDQFDITATVYNMAKDSGPYALKNVKATLILDEGLELVSGTPLSTIGDVPTNSDASTSWTVRPTGTRTGELTYRISASDANGWSQMVSNSIVVPGSPNTVLTGGYQMVNVPFTMKNSSPANVFGLAASDFNSWIWNPSFTSYGAVGDTVPGKAFWLNMKNLYYGDYLPVSLPSDAAPVSDDYTYAISTGWNMIGNPYTYPIYWGQVMFYDPTSRVSVSLENAVNNGWVSKILWSWNTASLSYDANTSTETILNPWQGYWIKAYRPLTVVMRCPVYPGVK